MSIYKEIKEITGLTRGEIAKIMLDMKMETSEFDMNHGDYSFYLDRETAIEAMVIMIQREPTIAGNFADWLIGDVMSIPSQTIKEVQSRADGPECLGLLLVGGDFESDLIKTAIESDGFESTAVDMFGGSVYELSNGYIMVISD